METVVRHATRPIVALVILIACGYASFAFCILPYRCNAVKAVTMSSTNNAFPHIGSPRAGEIARRNLNALEPCRRLFCRDLSTEMIAAANYRILGRNDEALRLYRNSLKRDQRPEIYYNIANTEVALGAREAALNDFVRACIFNPFMIHEIDDGQLHEQTIARLIQMRPEDAEFIRMIAAIQP